MSNQTKNPNSRTDEELFNLVQYAIEESKRCKGRAKLALEAIEFLGTERNDSFTVDEVSRLCLKSPIAVSYFVAEAQKSIGRGICRVSFNLDDSSLKIQKTTNSLILGGADFNAVLSTHYLPEAVESTETA